MVKALTCELRVKLILNYKPVLWSEGMWEKQSRKYQVARMETQDLRNLADGVPQELFHGESVGL